MGTTPTGAPPTLAFEDLAGGLDYAVSYPTRDATTLAAGKALGVPFWAAGLQYVYEDGGTAGAVFSVTDVAALGKWEFAEHNAENAAIGASAGLGFIWSMGGVDYINQTGGDALSEFSVSDVALASGVVARGAVADGVTDNKDVFNEVADQTGVIDLPLGTFLTSKGVPTSKMRGEGDLIAYAGSTVVTTPDLRKSPDVFKTRQAFEDEFEPHLTDGSDEFYYTGFGSGCMIEGREIYAVRTAYEHNTNHTYKSHLVLYFYDKLAAPLWTKATIYSTTTSEDIRDVNITPNRARQGYVLISFAEKLSAGGYQTRLISYNVRTETIESNRIVSGPSSDDFKWGNALITPTGKVMFCTYDIDGTAIKVWSGSLPTSGTVTVTAVKTFTDTVASEPTIGYWQDRLVLFYRRTAAASRLTYTYDLEGAGPWADTVFPFGVSAHSPCMIAYSDAEQFTALFSHGVDRSLIGAVSSYNLEKFTENTLFKTTNEVTGGYPSMVDCGGYYAVTIYGDHYVEVGETTRTRFERIELSKPQVQIDLADPNRVNIMKFGQQAPDAEGLWIGNPTIADSKYTSNGLNYQAEFSLHKSVALKGVAMMLSGTADGHVELYEDGVLIGTSAVTAVASTDPVVVVFTFASTVALDEITKYRVKLKGTAALGIFDYRHNSRVTSLMRHPFVDVTDFINSGGSSVGTTAMLPLGLRIL